MSDGKDSEFIITDDVLWDQPLASIQTITQSLLRAGHKGLFLRVPELVELESHGSLPMIAGFVTDRENLYSQRMQDRFIVVVTDLDSGEVIAKQVFFEEPSRSPVPFGKRKKNPGTSIHIGRVDLRKLLSLRWVPSRLSIRLVMMDQISDPVFVRLTPPNSMFDPTTIDAFITRERIRLGPKPILPDSHILSEQQQASPPVPSTPPGIDMRMERALLMGSPTGCPVYGSFYLPIYPWNIHQTDFDGNPVTPFASVPITLLIVGSEDLVPYVYPLQPVARQIMQGNNSQAAWGFFALDLFNTLKLLPREQTYAVYAISYGLITKPSLTTALSQDQLPIDVVGGTA